LVNRNSLAFDTPNFFENAYTDDNWFYEVYKVNYVLNNDITPTAQPLESHRPVMLETIDAKAAPDILNNYLMGLSQSPVTIRLDLVEVDRPIVISVADSVMLGRVASDNSKKFTIDLKPYAAFEKGVSRQHATLHRFTNILFITDLNSRNGTFLNGERLSAYQAHILGDGDEVHLGRLVFYVQLP
jgi:hypothetical protein